MCSWLGKDGDNAVEGMPHVMKIARKPKGKGCEMKAGADATTGIIFFVEIQEGADRMSAKDFVKPKRKMTNDELQLHNPRRLRLYQSTTACTLRLTRGYHYTNRIVIGDAWFASVNTLQALHEHGLFFTGIVKTAHRNYPSAAITQWSSGATNPEGVRPARGDHKVFLSNYESQGQNYQMMAVGWKDTQTKHIISNVGNTQGGHIVSRLRHSKIVDSNGVPETIRHFREYPQPAVVKEMFDAFPTIDIHDHLRQGILKMEVSWKTLSWQHRLTATMLGIIFTNTYLAYRYDKSTAGMETNDLRTFLDELAYDLIHYGEEMNNTVNIRHSTAEIDQKPEVIFLVQFVTKFICWIFIQDKYYGQHFLCRFAHDQPNKDPRLACCLCKRKTTYYCSDCSVGNNYYAICDPTVKGKFCYYEHMKL